MKQKILAQGAEAIITLTSQSKPAGGGERFDLDTISKSNKTKSRVRGSYAPVGGASEIVTKSRIKKSYRIPEIDIKLRKSRTRSESKIIKKLEKIIPVPKIISTDEKEIIQMEFIDGLKISENLEKLDYKKVSKIIAENLAKIHDQDIIHGDLTTSNMIYKDNKVYFIDFGLAFHSKKIEDKAVDLHLLQQALVAKHFTIWENCFKIILDNYNPKQGKLIKDRIKVIESRGRYKDKY